MTAPATTERRTTQLELVSYGRPGRDLPLGMLAEVSRVLEFHGLDAPIVELMTALARVVNATPVEQGGRLRPDGSLDLDDYS